MDILTKNKKNSLKEHYMNCYQNLLTTYPMGWYSGKFLDHIQQLIDDVYQQWKEAGLTDYEFELTFGGGKDNELIWYLFRPTFDISLYPEMTEDYDPPMVKQ